MVTPVVLWELRGQKTGTLLSCQLMHQSDDRWRLTVTMGEVKFHSETFRHQGDAQSQADFLYRDFLEEGWIDVFKADQGRRD